MSLEREPVPQAWRPDAAKPYEERYEWRLPGEEAFLREGRLHIPENGGPESAAEVRPT